MKDITQSFKMLLKKNRFSNKHILFFILLIAFILGFYNFNHIPFVHDEFSAIFRTYFHSFSELIQKGVIDDTHPVGIQIFYILMIFKLRR